MTVAFFYFSVSKNELTCNSSCNDNRCGKYVVGLKKFVERQMVEKFLSKNFRRHSTSSTKHFVEKYFVDKTFRRHGTSSTQHFVDTALRR